MCWDYDAPLKANEHKTHKKTCKPVTYNWDQTNFPAVLLDKGWLFTEVIQQMDDEKLSSNEI